MSDTFVLPKGLLSEFARKKQRARKGTPYRTPILGYLGSMAVVILAKGVK